MKKDSLISCLSAPIACLDCNWYKLLCHPFQSINCRPRHPLRQLSTHLSIPAHRCNLSIAFDWYHNIASPKHAKRKTKACPPYLYKGYIANRKRGFFVFPDGSVESLNRCGLFLHSRRADRHTNADKQPVAFFPFQAVERYATYSL